MLQIDFINVGYGDAILVREIAEQYRFTMLVDAGDVAKKTLCPGTARITAAEFLRQEGIDTIDLLVMTHIHRDHIGGIEELLPLVRVKRAFVCYLPAEERLCRRAGVQPHYEKWQRNMCFALNMHTAAIETMKASGTLVEQIDAPIRGMLLSQALTADVDCAHPEIAAICKKTLDGLLDGCPNEEDMTAYRKKVNLMSLRMRLVYRGRSILLTGDAYGWVWEDEPVQHCDILKMPHHGCYQSMSERLMEKLSPDYTVIPVSNDREDNRPSPKVMEIVKRHCPQIYFTDAVHVLDLAEPPHAAVTLRIDAAGNITVQR